MRKCAQRGRHHAPWPGFGPGPVSATPAAGAHPPRPSVYTALAPSMFIRWCFGGSATLFRSHASMKMRNRFRPAACGFDDIKHIFRGAYKYSCEETEERGEVPPGFPEKIEICGELADLGHKPMAIQSNNRTMYEPRAEEAREGPEAIESGGRSALQAALAPIRPLTQPWLKGVAKGQWGGGG